MKCGGILMSKDVTVGIIGLGSLGRAISLALADPKYKRINRLLLKNRNPEKVTRIKSLMRKNLDDRAEMGLEFHIEEASEIQIAEEANIAFMCFDNQYGVDQGIPYWESHFRQKFFNGNIESIRDYGQAFQGSEALMVMLTNPNIYNGFFFQQFSQLPDDQVVCLTPDTARAREGCTILPHVKARIIGDHGPNCLLDFEYEDSEEIEGDKQKKGEILEEVIRKGQDLIELYKTTSEEMVNEIQRFIEVALNETCEELVYGIPYDFNGTKIFSQFPARVVEKQPGEFRIVSDDEKISQIIERSPDVNSVLETIANEINLISQNGIKCKTKSSMALVSYISKKSLRVYDQRTQKQVLELTPSRWPIDIKTLENKIAVMTRDNRKVELWNLPSADPIQANLPETGSKPVGYDILLRPEGCIAAQHLGDRSLLTYFKENEDQLERIRDVPLDFMPSAIEVGQSELYLAQENEIKVLDAETFENIAQYSDTGIKGDITKISKVNRSEILAVASDEQYVLIENGKKSIDPTQRPDYFDVKRDHRNDIVIVSGNDRTLSVERLEDGKIVKTNPDMVLNDEILSVSFDPDDNYIYVGTQNNVVTVPYWKHELKDKTTFSAKMKGSKLDGVRYVLW